jgi:hypothetical protein
MSFHYSRFEPFVSSLHAGVHSDKLTSNLYCLMAHYSVSKRNYLKMYALFPRHTEVCKLKQTEKKDLTKHIH